MKMNGYNIRYRLSMKNHLALIIVEFVRWVTDQDVHVETQSIIVSQFNAVYRHLEIRGFSRHC